MGGDWMARGGCMLWRGGDSGFLISDWGLGGLFEEAFEDFAGAVAGEVGGELDDLGGFVGGDVLMAVTFDVRFGEADAGLGDDVGFDEFAEMGADAGGGDADDGDVGDAWMGEETVFDFDGVDVFAADDDHVFAAAFEIKVAFGVFQGEVAGVVPVAAHGFFEEVGLLPVGADDVAAVEVEFADFSGR